jgi:segregation and condensation protein A
MELSVHLEAFDGPLDLLLHLIDKNKVSIYDIPIADITDQYLEYLDSMRQADLDIMSEFLVMAATLLDIKSRMLLPQEKNEEGEEVDPRSELVERLLEYKMYRSISEELADLQKEAAPLYYHDPDIPSEVRTYEEPVDIDELLDGLTLKDLGRVFESVLRQKENRVDPIRSKFGKIEKEEVSLEDKMQELSVYAKSHRKFSFRQLLSGQSSRIQVIVTFLSILELMKTGQIRIRQEEAFGEIEITSNLANHSGS